MSGSASNKKTSLPEFSVAKPLTEMEIAPKIPFLQIVSKFLFEKKCGNVVQQLKPKLL